MPAPPYHPVHPPLRPESTVEHLHLMLHAERDAALRREAERHRTAAPARDRRRAARLVARSTRLAQRAAVLTARAAL